MPSVVGLINKQKRKIVAILLIVFLPLVIYHGPSDKVCLCPTHFFLIYWKKHFQKDKGNDRIIVDKKLIQEIEQKFQQRRRYLEEKCRQKQFSSKPYPKEHDEIEQFYSIPELKMAFCLQV